jgi:hypothetical protein
MYAKATAHLLVPSKLTFNNAGEMVIEKGLRSEFKIIFSPDLAKLFNISPSEIGTSTGFAVPDMTEKIVFKYKEPPTIVSGYDVFTVDVFSDPNKERDIFHNDAIKITGHNFQHIYQICAGEWTLSLLCDYINSDRHNYINLSYAKIEDVTTENDFTQTGMMHTSTVNYIRDFKFQFSPHIIAKLGITVKDEYYTAQSTQILFNYKMTLKAGEHQPRTIAMKKNAFGSIEAICNHINQTIKENNQNQQLFTFSLMNNNYVKVVAKFKGAYKLNMESSLLDKLALRGPKVEADKTSWLTFTTSYVIVGYNITQLQDFSNANPQEKSGLLVAKAISAFWLYTNIILEQVVGDRSIPLLRIVPNTAAEGTAHMEALDAQYLPVNTKRLSAINIRICNGNSQELVAFDNDVTCILHFKRVS